MASTMETYLSHTSEKPLDVVLEKDFKILLWYLHSVTYKGFSWETVIYFIYLFIAIEDCLLKKVYTPLTQFFPFFEAKICQKNVSASSLIMHVFSSFTLLLIYN